MEITILRRLGNFFNKADLNFKVNFESHDTISTIATWWDLNYSENNFFFINNTFLSNRIVFILIPGTLVIYNLRHMFDIKSEENSNINYLKFLQLYLLSS